MKLSNRIKTELTHFNKFEKIFYISIILLVFIVSIIFNDSKIALISALCGITYTLFAGKGKVYCYYTGIIGTFCYCYIAYKNGLYGNLALYGLYYLPIEIYGIFVWKKHLNKQKNEIIKTKLPKKEFLIYGLICLLLIIFLYLILNFYNDKNPILDSITVGLSILGQYLTLKRCIEQWYIWFLVNLISFIMWIISYINGSNCLATIIMWFIYLILSIYFYINWKKDINQKQV